MSSVTESFVSRVHQPEYTGENRCIPCTIVNLVIAAGLAVVVAYALVVAAGPTAAAAGGLATAAVSVGAIYFRGYLVPGTPTLTKRYFPDRVLRWFDKAPEPEPPAREVDPEEVLLEAGLVEPCEDRDDLCLDGSLRSAWREEIHRLRDDEDAMRARIATLVDVEQDSVAILDKRGSCIVQTDERTVARWVSREALVADLASVPVLREEFDGWHDLELPAQGQLLNGIRVFLEDCPACDGPLAFAQETKETCCREVEVVNLACQECDATLLQAQQ